MKYHSFEDLEFWKLGREFRIEISRIAKSLPSSEKYMLRSQIIRSSRSICDNIAEGHGRFHFQENIQFCRIARGSLEESLNQLITAKDEGYISGQQLLEFRLLHKKIMQVGNGYIRYLKNKKS